MEQFSLEEYSKNPNRKLVTRDGKSARIICTDKKDIDFYFPIVVLVDFGDREEVCHYTKNGYFIYDGREDKNDLFFATEKHEGYARIFFSEGKYYLDDVIYSSKEDAEKDVKWGDYVTTIKIEWEE